MKVCVAQINPTLGDLKGNTQKILQNIEKARKQHADIVLFSEQTICGYMPQDLLFHDEFIIEMGKYLQEIVKATQGICVIVGLVRHNQGKGKRLLNSAAILFDRKILGFYDKCLLPTYDVFDERRYFEPGREVKTWEIQGKKIAVIICEDIWQHAGYVEAPYARDPILELVSLKPDLLLNLSASPYQYEKPDIRVEVCAKAAKTLDCPVVLCCQVGANDDLVYDGYSVCVDEHGNLRQLGKGFAEDLFLVDYEAPICHIPFKYDQLHDLYRALVLGVHDYFYKQNFEKACIGLSGGIDSALVACIAKDALGAKNVLAISMPSQFSSEGSYKDAKVLAEHLGIDFEVIPIEQPFEEYLKLLEPHFEGMPENETEENLQSRIRGTILMAISNKLGYIVLSTGNKSELGVGYCTLYGDMCGGLGVISDVLKTRVYELARFVNKNKEIIPLAIIEKPPSAELRPNQLDIDTLPPYDIVDKVLKAYIEDNLSPEEIIKKWHFPKEIVEDLIKRVHRAEYKRRQAPPGIRVSRKAFSVGRRFPIVQGWVNNKPC